jgi:hypothetical protein
VRAAKAETLLGLLGLLEAGASDLTAACARFIDRSQAVPPEDPSSEAFKVL